MTGSRSADAKRGGARQEDRFVRWLSAGVAVHVLMLGSGRVTLPSELSLLLRELQREHHRYFAPIEARIEAPPPPPAPTAKEPEPEPEPVPPPKPVVQPPPPKDEPEPEPPPEPAKRLFAAAAEAVAQAAKILATDDDVPGAPSIASGNADGPTYGMVAGAGTGSAPTFNPRAGLTAKPGVPGGAPSAPPPLDRTRGAHVFGGFTEDCDFPPEADTAGIDHAAVTVVVTVGPNAAAEVVEVVDDPGHGFGRAARSCVLTKLKFLPARDREGNLLRAKTPPTIVRFTR
jgi:protein TonB